MKSKLPMFALITAAAVSAGVPEPDVVFYGRVTRSPIDATYVPAGVTWSISGNAETLAMSRTTVVTVNGETFYLTRIPFETRQLADHTQLPATPNTLSLPGTATRYGRSATVDGQAAEFVNPADSTFTYGSADQGLIQRVDLRLPGTPSDVDTDGDGMADRAELLAGTNPLDASSVLKAFSELRPELVAGHFAGIVLEWRSVAGRRYALHRSTDLKSGFQLLRSGITGTGEKTRHHDEGATGAGPFFYRLEVEQ